MIYPHSLQQTRTLMQAAIMPLHSIGVHYGDMAGVHSANAGAGVLANAIDDSTRTFAPTSFNALVVWVSGSSDSAFARNLEAINNLCPMSIFVTAARYGASLATIENDKFESVPVRAQSLEWCLLDSALSIPNLSNAYYDNSRSLLLDEGKMFTGSIDDELAALEQLKAVRDERLSNTLFKSGQHGLNTAYFSASNAQQLASNVAQLGDSNRAWAFVAFVGESDALQVVRELFGA